MKIFTGGAADFSAVYRSRSGIISMNAWADSFDTRATGVMRLNRSNSVGALTRATCPCWKMIVVRCLSRDINLPLHDARSIE